MTRPRPGPGLLSAERERRPRPAEFDHRHLGTARRRARRPTGQPGPHVPRHGHATIAALENNTVCDSACSTDQRSTASRAGERQDLPDPLAGYAVSFSRRNQ